VNGRSRPARQRAAAGADPTVNTPVNPPRADEKSSGGE
jgi:hypothetical protein